MLDSYSPPILFTPPILPQENGGGDTVPPEGPAVPWWSQTGTSKQSVAEATDGAHLTMRLNNYDFSLTYWYFISQKWGMGKVRQFENGLCLTCLNLINIFILKKKEEEKRKEMWNRSYVRFINIAYKMNTIIHDVINKNKKQYVQKSWEKVPPCTEQFIYGC